MVTIPHLTTLRSHRLGATVGRPQVATSDQGRALQLMDIATTLLRTPLLNWTTHTLRQGLTTLLNPHTELNTNSRLSSGPYLTSTSLPTLETESTVKIGRTPGYQHTMTAHTAHIATTLVILIFRLIRLRVFKQ